MKFYDRIGTRNGFSFQNTYEKSHYTALCAIEAHFMNFVFLVAAILDYSKSSANFLGGIFTESDSGSFKSNFPEKFSFLHFFEVISNASGVCVCMCYCIDI